MASVDDQLAGLTTMSSAQLKEEWSRLTQSLVPLISPKMMRLFSVFSVARSCQMAVESEFYSGQILSPILTCDHVGPPVSGGWHQNFPMF